jgi:3-oxoacyl-[acyl-carrier protein] reductase
VKKFNALITGASKGIGLEIAKLLSTDKRFNKVHCVARTQTKLPDVWSHCVDISNTESTRYHLKKILGSDKLDVLINCAGICNQSEFREAAFSDIQKEIQINVLGTMNVVHTVLPNMPTGSHVVTLSSLMGRVAVPTYSSYCASKFALVGFSEALRLENPHLMVSCLLPTLVDTTMAADKQPISNLIYAIEPDYVARKTVDLLFKHSGLKAIGAQAELACFSERVSPFVKRFML